MMKWANMILGIGKYDNSITIEEWIEDNKYADDMLHGAYKIRAIYDHYILQPRVQMAMARDLNIMTNSAITNLLLSEYIAYIPGKGFEASNI